MACPEQMTRPVLTSFSICLWNAFMCILSFWASVVLLLIRNLDLVSLQSLPLFYLFQWGKCSSLSLSVVCDFRLFRCFPSTLSSFAEKTFSGVMPLLSVPRFIPWGRENCALAFLETCLKCFDIRILTEGLGVTRGQSLWNTTELQGSSSWVNYERWLLVFNLEFVTISCELALTLGIPTLHPADNSQLSSFQTFLSYHQALSPA